MSEMPEKVYVFMRISGGLAVQKTPGACTSYTRTDLVDELLDWARCLLNDISHTRDISDEDWLYPSSMDETEWLEAVNDWNVMAIQVLSKLQGDG